MKKQKLTPNVLRQMSREERLRLLEQLRAELLKLRTQKERGIVENPGRFRVLRRTIARILTIENEEALKEKILNFLAQHKGKAFTVEEIAEAIGEEERMKFVRHMIWRLQLEGKVKKVGVRKYMLAEEVQAQAAQQKS